MGAGARLVRSPFLSSESSRLVLIILNNTLPKVTPSFWSRALYTICADGGANRLFDLSPTWRQASAAAVEYIPDLIKGDMDSIRQEVVDHYSSAGSRIDNDSEDQDSTDLQKCIWEAKSWLEKDGAEQGKATILALGAFGGRLDHTISNINALYANPSLDVVLCGEGSLARLLPEGKTEVHVSDCEGPHCGVVTLGQPARVSSTGMQWDMDNLELKIGGMLSTSNRICSKTISITTDHPVLWITEFKDTTAL